MATTISYENDLEQPITAVQKEQLDRYIKVTTVAGLVKIKEEFYKDAIVYLIYYKDPSELTNRILETYYSIPDVEIRERQAVGNYTLVNAEGYNRGILIFKGKVVFDQAGREIYSSPIDAISNIHNFEETNKYFYDPVTGEQMYVFWYGTNGALSSMDSYNPIHYAYINPFKDHFHPHELPTLKGLDWPNMTYFHAADPIIPIEVHLETHLPTDTHLSIVTKIHRIFRRFFLRR
ncbi:hypothetical protein [Mucilaginibacter sp.]|uniref:hypothetical protein n=1 Tax=Mucilaginibacter sp. TaxID=1882438 RepID=UPI0025FF94C9|nr:hypothetical protein [Mucilaginibacter sp.]